MLMLPELIVIAAGFIILLLDLFLAEEKKNILGTLAFAGLLIALGRTLFSFGQQGELFGGRFVVDSVAIWFKIIFLLAGMTTVALSWDRLTGKTTDIASRMKHRGEFYTILLFSTAGMMYLISSRDLVTLYISLELSTIPLFVLVAWDRDNPLCGEAGLKYVILGALSSAVLLYGLGILYGLSGSTDLATISQKITHSPALWLSVAMITAGIGFKLTLVPFHMWAADVYQGAPTPVTAHLSVASKAAGMAFIFLLFYRVLGGAFQEWNILFAVLATITMTLGNLVAIIQQNIKRFMAFSAISQAGYLIMGFLGPFPEGLPSMLFYLYAYIFTNLVVFAVIIFYANETGRENIDDYRGLSRTNPIIAGAMMLGLFSLAGIPPLSGFVGKFFLFSVASKAGFHWLVGVAAINSTISLYYYLRIVRQMYIEPTMEDATTLQISPMLAGTIAITTLGAVFFGIIPFFYETINQTVAASDWWSVITATAR
ncbi:MAG: NADH-quinone oxidoreductase subunit N [SAR324 cluster bacterium]|nr:NADH-quinone oxidoreductase subunit N [SAR324 cluster bacterium]